MKTRPPWITPTPRNRRRARPGDVGRPSARSSASPRAPNPGRPGRVFRPPPSTVANRRPPSPTHRVFTAAMADRWEQRLAALERLTAGPRPRPARHLQHPRGKRRPRAGDFFDSAHESGPHTPCLSRKGRPSDEHAPNTLLRRRPASRPNPTAGRIPPAPPRTGTPPHRPKPARTRRPRPSRTPRRRSAAGPPGPRGSAPSSGAAQAQFAAPAPTSAACPRSGKENPRRSRSSPTRCSSAAPPAARPAPLPPGALIDQTLPLHPRAAGRPARPPHQPCLGTFRRGPCERPPPPARRAPPPIRPPRRTTSPSMATGAPRPWVVSHPHDPVGGPRFPRDHRPITRGHPPRPPLLPVILGGPAPHTGRRPATAVRTGRRESSPAGPEGHRPPPRPPRPGLRAQVLNTPRRAAPSSPTASMASLRDACR